MLLKGPGLPAGAPSQRPPHWEALLINEEICCSRINFFYNYGDIMLRVNENKKNKNIRAIYKLFAVLHLNQTRMYMSLLCWDPSAWDQNLRILFLSYQKFLSLFVIDYINHYQYIKSLPRDFNKDKVEEGDEPVYDENIEQLDLKFLLFSFLKQLAQYEKLGAYCSQIAKSEDLKPTKEASFYKAARFYHLTFTCQIRDFEEANFREIVEKWPKRTAEQNVRRLVASIDRTSVEFDTFGGIFRDFVFLVRRSEMTLLQTALMAQQTFLATIVIRIQTEIEMKTRAKDCLFRGEGDPLSVRREAGDLAEEIERLTYQKETAKEYAEKNKQLINRLFGTRERSDEKFCMLKDGPAAQNLSSLIPPPRRLPPPLPISHQRTLLLAGSPTRSSSSKGHQKAFSFSSEGSPSPRSPLPSPKGFHKAFSFPERRLRPVSPRDRRSDPSQRPLDLPQYSLHRASKPELPPRLPLHKLTALLSLKNKPSV